MGNLKSLKVDMSKKNGWFFMMFFVAYGFLTAQKNIDSLLKVAESTKEDTVYIKTYLSLSSKLKNSNLNKSIEYANLALQKSINSTALKYIGLSYKYFADAYFSNEKYDSALKYYYLGLDFIFQQNDVKTYNTIHKKIGTIYFYTENYTKALEYYLINLKVSEQEKNTEQINGALSNIGNIYKEQGKLKEAYGYLNRSMQNSLKDKDYHTLCIAEVNMGNLYNEWFKKKGGNFYLDSALYYYLEAHKIMTNNPDSAILGMLYCNIANVYTDKKERDLAITYYIKAIAIREKTQDYAQMAILYQDLASCYIEMHQLDKAKKYLDLGIGYAKENNALGDLSELYQEYAAFYEIQHNFKKAYEYQVLYKQYADSVFNEEGVEKRKEIEMNFSFEKEREKQKAEEEKKEVIRKEEKKRSAWYIAISIGGIFISVFIALIIFRNFKRSQRAHAIISKQKTEIEKQKHFVEEKNKEVMDSIHYAKRIQRALLTSENYFKKHVSDFFIFYKPKDIVSGDFYWALNLNNKFYLATADCTGHGVPGAFMSLLNISFLNEVIIEKKITRPDLILDEIRNDIIKALNPEGNEAAKDGMDCSLCCFDFEKMELQVAAANNPVWIMRNNIILEIKPDKMPVGMYADEIKPFSLQIFKLEKGDTVYTFTDGYADQFGGPKGKKFKYKQLENNLIANNYKPLAEQKEILSQAFDKWKEGLEQVDDVLLIAIKV